MSQAEHTSSQSGKVSHPSPHSTTSTPTPGLPTPLPSKPETVTGKLCAWIHSIQLSEIPADVVTRAKYLILDGLACSLVGAKLPWSVRAAEALIDIESSGVENSRGKCSVIGWGSKIRLSPLTAVVLNSAFIQGFELDDFHSTAPLHSNALLLPTLFATAEFASNDVPHYSGSDLLRAYIVGCEVGPRVGMALHGADLLTRGWHSGAVQGPSAVAASISKFMNLSPQQTEWALGTACTQAGGLMSAQFGSMAKRMQHGFSARNGLMATVLASQGYTGIEDVYGQSYGGFLSCFGQGSNFEPATLPEELVKGLGSEWELNSIRVKLHAAMAALHGSIDCIETLQKEFPKLLGLDNVDNIKEITTRHSIAAYEHGGWIAPEDKVLSSTGAQMSIQYAVATQLLDGEVWVSQFDSEHLHRPETRSLMNKIKPSHYKEYDEKPGLKWSTKATIVFNDSTEIQTENQAPKGIAPPASNEDIQQKWRKLAGIVIDQSLIHQIEDLVLKLETLEDVTKLSSLLGEICITKSPIA